MLDSLSSFYLSTVSPLNDPVRFAFTFLFGTHFFIYSLRFFHSLNSGVTILFNRHRPITTFVNLQVRGGHTQLPQRKSYYGIVKSYNSPLSTAFLGLLFFAASVVLLVIMFKRIDYIY